MLQMLEGWQETQAECRQTNASIKDSEEQIKEYSISLLRRKEWAVDQAKGKGQDTERASQRPLQRQHRCWHQDPRTPWL